MAISLRVLSVATVLLLAVVSSADEVHDSLAKYGLPKGIVPDSVVRHSLSDNGEFMLELAAPCYIQFSHLVYYEKIITGKISYGAISDITGIQAKKFFVWVSITAMKVHSDEGTIEFDVGIFSENISAKEFETIRHCEAKASSRGVRGFFPEELLPLPVSEVNYFPS